MKKLFLKISVFVYFFFGIYSGVFGFTGSVEDIFIDIDSDYEYLSELQALYERGMILADISQIFGPDQFLSRDEFVGISLEVACERCVQPYTDFGLVEKYFGEQIFFDLDTRNPYFYCIAEADTNNSIRGYDIGESCQNGESQLGERPFCPANFITREEAVAVLLRNAGIYTIENNREVIRDIDQGLITQNIANDVNPKNEDGSANTFYGYLDKALNYQIDEYDTNGTQKIYKLLEVDTNGNLNTGDYVTKEDFLKMAYIVFRSNSCVENSVNNTLATNINIYTADCSPESTNCEISDLNSNNNIYDFSGKIDGPLEEGIDEFTGYKWRFLNISTGEEFLRTGDYLDNLFLETKGEWFISLYTQDKSGNRGYASSTIVYNDGNDQLISEDQPTNLSNGDSGNIYIYGGSCNGESCEQGNTDTLQNNLDISYDFEWRGSSGNISSTDAGNPTWIFTNVGNGTTERYTTKGISNYQFGTGGNWNIKYEFTGNNGEKIRQEVNIEVGTDGGITSRDTSPLISGNSNTKALSTNIITGDIFGYTDFIGKFDVQTNGGSGNYSYSWDFGDGQNGIGKNVEHVYTQGGNYTVQIEVRDDTGNIGNSEMTIQVLDGDRCLQDADGDTLFDCEDLCPLVAGSPQNSGCPILYEKCDNSCGCSEGYSCDSSDTATCSISGVCLPDTENFLLSRESCLYAEGTGNIFGNTTCTTCPCDTKLDFFADIRPCDILFPAITSPDGSEIYSQGNLFEIK